MPRRSLAAAVLAACLAAGPGCGRSEPTGTGNNAPAGAPKSNVVPAGDPKRAKGQVALAPSGPAAPPVPAGPP